MSYEAKKQADNAIESSTLLEFNPSEIKTAWNCLKCYPKICRCNRHEDEHFAQGCNYMSNYSNDHE